MVLKRQVELDPTGTHFILSGILPADKTEHCQCGNEMGCPDCYGKLNCGCADCVKPLTRKVMIKKAKSLVLKTDKAPIFETDSVISETAIVSHVVSDCKENVKINSVVTEVCDVVLRRSHKSVDYKRRPMSFVETPKYNVKHRMSMPEMPKFELKKSEPKARERRRESYDEKNVGPPKQTRYFCKTCNASVCNACFTARCGAHNVQFLGSAYFHCQSPFHKIQHDHVPQ